MLKEKDKCSTTERITNNQTERRADRKKSAIYQTKPSHICFNYLSFVSNAILITKKVNF